MRISLVILTIILFGCDEARIYGGLGYKSDKLTNENWQDHDDPLGFARVEANKYFGGFFVGGYCEHLSSIPQNSSTKDGTGMNYCGPHGGYQWGGRP